MEDNRDHIQKVDAYLLANQNYFPPESIGIVREKLLKMDESRFWMLPSLDLKDPTTMLLISIFLGYLGVDRFMLGDTGMGILKLLTGGVCGILAIIDWFSIQKMTRDRNFNRIMQL
ncbi:MAG TPA: TM2 domain-containing protein [Clostridiales bacterium]|jgi:TM2 domain-containing membrane protein YozV|nr:TM2 domain-containing protein [Clostridiales bacterium]